MWCVYVMMQKMKYCIDFAAALLHEVDLVMLSMQELKLGVIKDSLFDFHPAPRFVKGALHQYVGIKSTACIIFSCQVTVTFISIQLSMSASLYYNIL